MKGQESKLKVLVADSSSHARLVLENILSGSADMEVTGLASNGAQVLELLRRHQVDVILASVDLRKNEQLLVFKQVFSECPTPIVMLVEKEQLSLELLKDAIDLGVYSVILKPGPTARPAYRTMAEEICRKVSAVRDTEYWDPQKRLSMLGEEMLIFPQVAQKDSRNVTADTIIVIGASTGGTQAVEQIIRQLDPRLKAAVLVAIHLPPKFTHSYSRRLKGMTELTVLEGRTGLIPKPGKVIIAPGGRNMIVHTVMGNASSLKIGFSEDSGAEHDLPSVDKLMQAVAQSGVRRVIGVILTGMGKDGTAGAKAIALRKGGHVIAQDEASSAIFGMAKSAIESGNTDKVLPLSKIAQYLNRYVAAEQQQVSTTDVNS
ncbi:chemotaxis protein CheB [Pontibacter sp. BAB1700]|uniref:chemotaxis protein CheB n=1 Tax=Pontibacter sp. BAB1700 TaxID=1144253 RepID=UPI00026BCE17|nr:chemotaxis protein CheB [Pontibacter sp. BAB1700]EJF09126.1 response regulator receiver modulated CheB methylesterase [Pontibacter sp. BAB1700]